MSDTISLDIVSDVICPWCFIGKRRFDEARAAEPEGSLEVHWRPYQLDPTIPTEGLDRRAYLKAKFGDGDQAKAINKALHEAGEAAGIPFRFDKIERTPNTLDAHRLIRWSRSAGVQDQVVETLFKAYFIDGEDISDHRVLTAIAASVGMDPVLVGDLLSGESDKDLIAREVNLARQMGVQGVPCFILDGNYAVMGAQESGSFTKVFASIREDKAAKNLS